MRSAPRIIEIIMQKKISTLKKTIISGGKDNEYL